MTGLEGLLAGRTLGGRYLVEEVIGRGGMGAVYRALDERLGRRVALKVITLAGDPEARERLRARFHREARAAAALPHHPNVVPVYDYGTDEVLGLDYIVMELLRGNDLATRLARSGAPPLPAALKILLQAARGLAVGHRARLIHRDVKPGNIFLAEGDHNEIQVRVVDFGIAKLADEEDTANQLTQDGRTPHSPAFASPEQLRGLSKLTPASDVFSLGAVGFLLLTGERPFSETDRNRMSLGMPATAPSLRAKNPAVPAVVEAAIQRSLDFDPENRFPDAGAFLVELERAVREMPDTPVDPYAAPVLAPAMDDDRTQLQGPLADDDDRTRVMEAGEDDRTLLAAPEAAAPPPRSPSRAVPRTAPPPPEPPRKRRTALVVWSVVLLALAGVGLWAVMENSGGPSTIADVRPDTLDSLAVITEDSVLPEDVPTVDDALAFNAEGLRHFRAQRLDSAVAYFRRAVDIAPDNADFRRNLGVTLLERGRAEEAVEQLRQAVSLDPGLDIAYANLAQAQLARFDTAGAVQSLQRYAEIGRNPDARESARRKLEEIRAVQLGVLGEPVDTASLPPARPDTIPREPDGGA